MSVCPNKNLKEWKILAAPVSEGGVGEFEAYRDFMETGEIRSPEIVSAKVGARNYSPVYQLQRTESDGTPTSIQVLSTLLESLSEKFGPDYGYRIDENIEDGYWKGRVEPPSQFNGNKPTIVINAKLATLDTPLHEFGHIFLNLIKQENLELYTMLRQKIKQNKVYAETLNEVKAKYSQKFPDMKEWEFEEEAIVELLGKFAADEIDPQTGLYKALNDFWEAVKEAFKKILQMNRTYREQVLGLEGAAERRAISTIDLSANASIEVLAKLLAKPDIKIVAAESTKEKVRLMADAYDNLIEITKEEHNKVLGLLNSEDGDKYLAFIPRSKEAFTELDQLEREFVTQLQTEGSIKQAGTGFDYANYMRYARGRDRREDQGNLMLHLFDEKTSALYKALTTPQRLESTYNYFFPAPNTTIESGRLGKNFNEDFNIFIEEFITDISSSNPTVNISADDWYSYDDLTKFKNKIFERPGYELMAWFFKPTPDNYSNDNLFEMALIDYMGEVSKDYKNLSFDAFRTKYKNPSYDFVYVSNNDASSVLKSFRYILNPQDINVYTDVSRDSKQYNARERLGILFDLISDPNRPRQDYGIADEMRRSATYLAGIFPEVKVLARAHVKATEEKAVTRHMAGMSELEKWTTTGVIEKETIKEWFENSIKDLEKTQLQIRQGGKARFPEGPNIFGEQQFTYRLPEDVAEQLAIEEGVDLADPAAMRQFKTDRYTVKARLQTHKIGYIINLDFESKEYGFGDPLYSEPVKENLSNIRVSELLTENEKINASEYRRKEKNIETRIAKMTPQDRADDYPGKTIVQIVSQLMKEVVTPEEVAANKKANRFRYTEWTFNMQDRSISEVQNALGLKTSPHGYVVDVMKENGEDFIVIELYDPSYDQDAGDAAFARKVPNVPGRYIVKPEQIRVVKPQTRPGVSSEVIAKTLQAYPDVDIAGIAFMAAGSAPGAIKKFGHRDSQTMRWQNYRNWAQRLFRNNYAGVVDGPSTTIIIPEGYRQGLSVSKELYQLASEKTSEVPVEDKNSLTGIASEQTTVEDIVNETNDSKVEAIELANKMSEALGIEYQIVTAKDAEVLTQDAKNPWNGESAFFIGGRVYFVGDNMSTDQVFHEFSHPFVRALSKDNPKLFNNLYNQVFNTPEGQELIERLKEQYSDLDPNSDLFKEEVIVTALGEQSIYEQEQLKTPSAFNKAINNILYAIKQLMRNVFGKNSDVAKLRPDTTLKEVVQMLNKGEVIEINTDSVSQEDVAAYMRNQKQYVDDLMEVKDEEIQALINRVYDVSTRHINQLLENNEFDELASILTDENRMGELDAIKSRVQEYQTMVGNMAKETVTNMEQFTKKANALVDTLFRLDTVMEKVLLHMEDIRKERESQDNLAKVHYYKELIDYWSTFIEEINTAINDPKNNIPNNSSIGNLVSGIERTVKKIENLTNDIYADGARDVLYDQLEPMGRSIKKRYETQIEDLIKRKASPKRIDQLHSEYYGLNRADYQRMKDLQNAKFLSIEERNELSRLERESAEGLAITPEKIERLLKGQMGDANFFNSYLEGYLYNTDPIIGGLALYVKNNMNEVMATAQAKYNDFAREIQPLQRKAGYTNSRLIGKMGQDLGFVDKIATRDQDGKLIEAEVWSLLNPFKNYRYDQAALDDAVEKAHYKYIQEGTPEAKQEWLDALAEKQQTLRKYFNQEYVAEFYKKQEIFERDDIGKEAMAQRRELFERIRMLTEPAKTQTDNMLIADELDALWREYRQMHSEYYLDGKKKFDDPSKGIYDLSIAQRLKEYREASGKFYEDKLRKGAFENAYRSYEQELVDSGIKKTDTQFNVLMAEWVKRNTQPAIKQKWYDDRLKKINRIKEIMKNVKDDAEREELDQSNIWKEIFDLVAGFKDNNNQLDGSLIDPNSVSQIKDFQIQLQEMKKKFNQRNGLTEAENERLTELHEFRKAGDPRFNAAELRSLYDKKNRLGLNQWQISELNGLYEDLAGMAETIPTDYYMDILNNWLSQLDTSSLFIETGSRSITPSTAHYIYKPSILNNLLGQNAEFDKWFSDNHLQKKVYNKETKEKENVWERVYVWNQVRPTDLEAYEQFTFKDSDGNEKTIQGKPSKNYYTRVVKPEYKTKKIVGVTVDNRGQWLPKTEDQGAFDDKYINKKYYRIKEQNKPLFELLEAMTKHHLKNQEGLNYKSKLYLDYPRFKKSTLEVLQTRKVKDLASEKSGYNALTIYAQRVRDFLKGDKGEEDAERSYRSDFNLVRADMFDNEITDVPIAGLYNTDIRDVSTDITHTMMRYMISGERQKQLIKINPVAKAIQSVVNDPKNAIKEVDKVNKFNFINRGIKTYLNRKGKNVRQRAINNFIEREFEGQAMTGATKDVAWLNNFANLMFKRASFGFFALNIPSALKNSYGAKFQGMIEASAGKYYNHADFQKGNAWSYTTMGELSFGGQLYNKADKSLRQQIVDIFDPSQGRFEEKFGEGMSRTLLKDVAGLSWLYNTRKWVELQATLQIFGGMMYGQKVKMFEGTPQEKTIPYIDAWQKVDGKIQLKEGVDPEWGITYNEAGEMKVGKEYSRKKNEIHQVMNDLQGAYAKFDQPEAQRYLAFRFLSYLRRYFTTMTMNRFGFSGRWFDPKPRLNPGLGDFKKGYYIEFLGTVKRAVLSLGRELPYMTADEKRAALKVISEVALLVATNMAMGLLFGWDPDDDEKYEKLRQRSGALPFLFAGENQREFDTWGFFENHALFLLMNIRAENEQFLPLPGFGMDDYTAMLDLKSIAFGPTVKTYGELFDDSINILSGSDKAYYKRDIGPYSFQQEGGSKFWAHMGRTIGLTGSSLDPAKAIKGFQSVQSRAR